MVDWDQVERLRGKGWEWSRIAADERVEFTADASGGDAGRQLRALYYQRRSKAQRRGGAESPGGGKGEEADTQKPPLLLRIGYVLVPLVAIWFVLAFLLPSPIGVEVPWLYLLVALVVVAFVLIYALLRAPVRWESALRVPVVLGVVLGFVAAGTVTLVALSQGCPLLTTSSATSVGEGWAKYTSDPVWKVNGAPVFFFYGSIACPYCSASSWAMTLALEQFGTLTGQVYGSSNPGDVYPNTPEVELDNAALRSNYVDLNAYEGNDDSQITTPALPGCQFSAYVTTYSGGSIPFVVIDGQYVHATNSLVDPQQLQVNNVAISPSDVQGQIDNESGTAWNAIAPAAFAMMAIILVANGEPAALTAQVEKDYPSVASYVNQVK